MMTKIGLSTYSAGLLALLGYLQFGCATDPNQAGPSRPRNEPALDPSAATIPGATEWLRLYKSLFSRDIEPANAPPEETVLAILKRMVELEGGRDFKIARRCVLNESNRETVRQMSPSEYCSLQIESFVEAFEERDQLEQTRRARGLAGQAQSLMEQLAKLSRLDEQQVCQIESLKSVRDLSVLYQKWPILHRYISLQLDSRRQFCFNLFMSIVSSGVVRLRDTSKPFFGLLDKIQHRLGTNFNRRPPPFVHIPEFSEDALYQAVANEIRALGRYDLSTIADLEIQRGVVRELKRLCSLVLPNNVVNYYNQILELLDINRLKPITISHLSMDTRHIPKFEICNRLWDDNFSADRVGDEINHLKQIEALIAMVHPDRAIYEPSQELDYDPRPSLNLNLKLGQLSNQQIDTMAPPASPRVESEVDFYKALASAVAENYQRDSAIEPVTGDHYQ